jgi:pimeloyl-ACP methyl ester carboxylesterase
MAQAGGSPGVVTTAPVGSATLAGMRAKTFVLVHGSWQGAWCWEGVRARLQDHGHRVLAPSLPGRGDVADDRSAIGHEDNIAAVLLALGVAGDEPVALVGHSLGGVTISQVADRRPQQIDRLVYCAGFVLEDGQAAADVMPDSQRAAFAELSAARPDRAITLPWQVWRANFIQTADEQLARASFARLVPDPYRPVFDPIRLRRPVHRELPTCFITLRDDLTFPVGFWHPGMTGKLDGARVVEIDGDHEAMLSAPARLADALHNIVTTGA